MPAKATSRYLSPGNVYAEADRLLAQGHRLALVAAHDDGDSLRIVYLFEKGDPDRRIELTTSVNKSRPKIHSLAQLSFPASRFEREMQDLFGIVPLEHPQPRRLVLHQHWPQGWFPMRKEVGTPTRMVPDAGSYPFVPVEGTGVYEIPVGPVHAGLIEPGHFRFWVIGETIMRMKARLWFVHKGIEKLFEGKTIQQGMTIAERVSGDSAVGHGLAYCLCIEDALGIEVDEQSGMIRSMLLELERLYNHVGDIGALCNEVGYGIALARALTLRESLLRLNHSIAGHRLLRGGVVPGGVRLARFPTIGELGAVELALEELVELVFAQSTVRERFTGTAVLTEDAARELGVVGLVARASSLPCDARVSNPFAKLPGCFDSVRGNGGDVMARLQVRVEEARISLKMVFESTGIQLASSQTEVERYQNTKESASGTGIVEAWRGAAVHRVEIARGGILTRLKIVDPSFFNWPALPVSLSETIVPDFPLANKSFNLSYAGNDL